MSITPCYPETLAMQHRLGHGIQVAFVRSEDAVNIRFDPIRHVVVLGTSGVEARFGSVHPVHSASASKSSSCSASSCSLLFAFP